MPPFRAKHKRQELFRSRCFCRILAKVSSSQPYSRWKVIAVGAAVGAAYGLFIRASIQVNLSRSVLGVISVAFLLVTPFAMGFLTTFYIERRRAQSIWMWLVLGWIPVLASTMGMFIVAWEGLICIAMYLPIGLSCATIGGLLGGYTARVLQRSAIKNLPMACVAVLPLLVAPWEERAFLHRDLHTVESVITIHAPAETVWRNIERVRAIRPEELTPSWTRALGFPAPIEATLICPGEPETFPGDPKQCAGRVRHATFAGRAVYREH